MLILGIETSCDETSAALVENGKAVHANIIASSKLDFERSGGVIPEYAARRQLECILPVMTECLKAAKCTEKEIDAIAVTYGPGLLGSLLVGTTTARTLAWLWNKPLIGVHHHQGHLDSIWLDQTEEISFPILTLSVSGGHTELWLRESHTTQTQIGSTRDDAAGEAFDKGALQLGLPYPGGPELAKLAMSGDEHAYDFPVPLAHEDGLEFSFSGLKTSLKYLLRDLGVDAEKHFADIAASYQHAICMHLVRQTKRALEKHPEIKEVHIVGGVSANTRLRDMLKAQCDNVTIRWPQTLAYCTDNGAMIAAAAFFTQNKAVWSTQASAKM